ncbi:hypothetical protein NDU88_006854 [Pleurodeles waltl]|uniref:Uncharacterized protein n=1 Tax=Pleurodeles waltl TaxID=8319 RepID=A0AAV7VN22_PLEWA|nr:hypothetical protein NDU88_006854 [Pleurodeles waltl]
MERQGRVWWEEYSNESNEAPVCTDLAQLEWSEEEGMSEEEVEVQFLEPKRPLKVYGKGVGEAEVQHRHAGEEERTQLRGAVIRELGRQVCKRGKTKGQLVDLTSTLDNFSSMQSKTAWDMADSGVLCSASQPRGEESVQPWGTRLMAAREIAGDWRAP